MTAMRLGLGTVYAVLLFACSLDSPSLLTTGPIATIGAMDRFTPEERSRYLADQQYLHRLVPPGVRVELDLSDPRQYRFAVSRLELAGKTSANAPQLFARIAARGRAGSKSRGAGADTASLASQHEIVDVHLGTPDAPNLISATAVASPDAAASYRYLDIAITTVTEVPIGPLQWIDQFDRPEGGLANLAVSTSGDRSAADVDRYVISSLELEETPDDVIESYIHLEIGEDDPCAIANFAHRQAFTDHVAPPPDTLARGTSVPERSHPAADLVPIPGPDLPQRPRVAGAHSIARASPITAARTASPGSPTSSGPALDGRPAGDLLAGSAGSVARQGASGARADRRGRRASRRRSCR